MGTNRAARCALRACRKVHGKSVATSAVKNRGPVSGQYTVTAGTCAVASIGGPAANEYDSVPPRVLR